MAIYMLPAALALAFKLGLLVIGQSSKRVDRKWVAFAAILAVHNASELMVLRQFAGSLSAEWIVESYYICSIAVITYGIYYVMETSMRTQRIVLASASILGLLLAGLIALTDHVIAGHIDLAYSLTALKGPLYLLFTAYALTFVSAIGAMLVYNYKTATLPMLEVGHGLTAIAITPLVLGTMIIVSLMMMGIHINATVITPIFSSLFLWITFKGKDANGVIYDPRNNIPQSVEAKNNKMVEKILAQYKLENLPHNQAMASLERELIQYKLKKNHDVVAATARSMGIPRSTLISKIRTLVVSRPKTD